MGPGFSVLGASATRVGAGSDGTWFSLFWELRRLELEPVQMGPGFFCFGSFGD